MKNLFVILFCVVLASCARNLDSGAYVSSDEAGIVNQGTIISVRQVTVKNTDKLEGNGLGVLGGGIAGGVAGSTVGGGNGKALATVGGALAGAALGALAQDQLGESIGYEYIVKLEGGKKSEIKTREETEITLGRESVKDKLKKTINTAETETNLISVVQGTDVLLQAGQKVYVIYNSDRIRLVPAN